MGFDTQAWGATKTVVASASSALAETSAGASSGRAVHARPEATASGIARMVSARWVSRVVRAPKGASHSSFR